MGDGQDVSGAGGVAGYGGDGRHREGEEVGNHRLEDVDHVAEAGEEGRGAAGLRPAEVESVREELPGGCGDERSGGGAGGLRFDVGYGGPDCRDEVGVEAVLVVTDEG